MEKGYCQSCGKDLSFIGGDMINNFLYCSLAKRECGEHELIKLFNENIGIYSLTKINCNSRLIHILNRKTLQREILGNKEITYTFPTFLLKK